MGFPLERWAFEQWPLAHSDSGLGHQCKGLRCGLLSMEFCMIYSQKDWRGQVLGFSPLSRNASFDRGKTIWRRNRISTDTTKGRHIWINGYFRCHFMIVDVEQIVYFPQQSRCYERKGRSLKRTYDIRSLEALYQTLQHVHTSVRTPSRFVRSLTSLQRGLEVPVEWSGSRASAIENSNLAIIAHG